MIQVCKFESLFQIMFSKANLMDSLMEVEFEDELNCPQILFSIIQILFLNCFEKNLSISKITEGSPQLSKLTR